ncbi:MAG: addiction module protein [Gammaproteobacteria bacterium]
MNTTLKQIAQEALQLTTTQRAELADFLVESLNSAKPDELQRLWIAEANKRLTEVRSESVKTISGEVVLAEARRLVKR